jgi:SAM-dependent methyltransferase
VTPRARPTHPAVRGFDRAAAAYERARPGYPAAAIRHVARTFGLGPGRTVVELASGTGKLTRALRPIGAAVVAVEPTRGMRDVFRRTMPDVAVLDGTAEAIPLPAGLADAVVVGQAFHWFRPGPALREIARVLRPRGGLALLWNTRDETVGYSRRLTEIFDRYRRETPRAREESWRAAFDRAGGRFEPLRPRSFRHVQRLTPAKLLDRVRSVSVIAVLPAAEQRDVLREVRALLAADPGTRGRRSFDLPYRTDVFTTRRR